MTRGLRERADMQKFVSQSTMEMIQSTSKASASERKRLTMLFSDVRGFTRFAEQRQPEEAVEWLNRCLGLQADLVRKHNGDVDKFVGDAVFALFDGEDMAFDAVRCAVEIQRQMDDARSARTASRSKSASASSRATCCSAASAATIASTTPRSATR